MTNELPVFYKGFGVGICFASAVHCPALIFSVHGHAHLALAAFACSSVLCLECLEAYTNLHSPGAAWNAHAACDC